MTQDNLRLSLGPNLFYWSKDRLFEFYGQVAEMPVDIVYLGETVCSKRRSLTVEDWIEIGDKLAAAGKEVVLSTLALLEAESELMTLRKICENGRFMVEANDFGAINLLAGKTEFTTGPMVNIYNPATLSLLAKQGLKRWVLPVELSHDTLADMQAARPEGVETELFSFGQMPLTLSARCFTARYHNLPKDDCQYRCGDYPDGQPMSTRDDEDFLVINGIQTLSARNCDLLGELDEIKRLGVDILRISPQHEHTGRITELFAEAIQGGRPLNEIDAELAQLAPIGVCDGYWHGEAGMANVTAAAKSL